MEYSSWSRRILETVDFLLYVIQVSHHIRHLLVRIPYQSPINVCIDFSVLSNLLISQYEKMMPQTCQVLTHPRLTTFVAT